MLGLPKPRSQAIRRFGMVMTGTDPGVPTNKFGTLRGFGFGDGVVPPPHIFYLDALGPSPLDSDTGKPQTAANRAHSKLTGSLAQKQKQKAHGLVQLEALLLLL